MPRKSKTSGPNRADLLEGFEERLQTIYIEEGGSFVKIPEKLARAVLEMAKRAPQPKKGPRALSARTRAWDRIWAIAAVCRKRELIADAKAKGRHLSADAAAWQAAKDISKSSRLSATAIRDLMDRRKLLTALSRYETAK
jgi:hypothetical protein